jgi:glycosyltransferase involved in cell wall biosynthesis
MAQAIDSLLADDALRRRMGEAARERVLERYTIEP